VEDKLGRQREVDSFDEIDPSSDLLDSAALPRVRQGQLPRLSTIYPIS